MLLRALTNGSVTGTGTLDVKSFIVGGILITTDNSTQGTVRIRRINAEGKQIIEVKTVTSMWVSGPFSMEEAKNLYYEVSGNNCEAQFYEWVT